MIAVSAVGSLFLLCLVNVDLFKSADAGCPLLNLVNATMTQITPSLPVLPLVYNVTCVSGFQLSPGVESLVTNCSTGVSWTIGPLIICTAKPTTSGFKVQMLDMMSPVGSPSSAITLPTVLECGRACLTSPLCLAYSVDRNVQPAGGVNCRMYNQLTGLQADALSTTYVSNGNTLPTI